MNLNIQNKSVLITGGTRGIGKSIEGILEGLGCNTLVTGRSVGLDSTKKILHGNFDILINCFGGCGSWGTDRYHEFEEWGEVLKRNLGVTVRQTSAVLPYMIEKGWGRVITISSIYGKEAGGRPWFTTAKASQIAYMKSMSKNPLYRDITFNCISPGFINTKESIKERARKLNAPLGESSDVAYLVAFLCSDKARFINGENIVIDGGYSNSF